VENKAKKCADYLSGYFFEFHTCVDQNSRAGNITQMKPSLKTSAALLPDPTVVVQDGFKMFQSLRANYSGPKPKQPQLAGLVGFSIQTLDGPTRRKPHELPRGTYLQVDSKCLHAGFRTSRHGRCFC
jgi:hypothetical protein